MNSEKSCVMKSFKFGYLSCVVLFFDGFKKNNEFKWFIRSFTTDKNCLQIILWQYIRAIVGITSIFTHLQILVCEALAPVTLLLVSCLVLVFLLNGNIVVLSSCVELVRHSLGIASTPVEEYNTFLASSHIHINISGLEILIDTRIYLWVGLPSGLQTFWILTFWHLLLAFHTAVSNKVNGIILLMVTKSFNTFLFYPFLHLDLDLTAVPFTVALTCIVQ